MLRVAIAGLVIALSMSMACTTSGTTGDRGGANGVDTSDSRFAPTPFSAEQIRDATQDGRRYTFDMSVRGKRTGQRIMTFSNVSAQGATISSHNTDLQGVTVGAVMSNTVTWEDLRKHAEYPRGGTTIVEAKVTVPAGSYDCKQYTVVTVDKNGAETVTLAWFATKLPGAPVKMDIRRNGEPILGMALAKHRASNADAE